MLGLKGGVPFLFWGDDFLENVNFICIVLSLLMSVYICDEFSYGTVSPYAQCNFSSYITTERPEDKPKQSFLFKNRDYHIDFVIADVILSLFIILVSVNIFKKQNI